MVGHHRRRNKDVAGEHRREGRGQDEQIVVVHRCPDVCHLGDTQWQGRRDPGLPGDHPQVRRGSGQDPWKPYEQQGVQSAQEKNVTVQLPYARRKQSRQEGTGPSHECVVERGWSASWLTAAASRGPPPRLPNVDTGRAGASSTRKGCGSARRRRIWLLADTSELRRSSLYSGNPAVAVQNDPVHVGWLVGCLVDRDHRQAGEKHAHPGKGDPRNWAAKCPRFWRPRGGCRGRNGGVVVRRHRSVQCEQGRHRRAAWRRPRKPLSVKSDGCAKLPAASCGSPRGAQLARLSSMQAAPTTGHQQGSGLMKVKRTRQEVRRLLASWMAPPASQEVLSFYYPQQPSCQIPGFGTCTATFWESAPKVPSLRWAPTMAYSSATRGGWPNVGGGGGW